jgi:hypothetical protein
MPSHCLIVNNWRFQYYFLIKTNQSSTLQAFMNKYNLKLTFIKKITINDTRIDHIWTNAPIQQCHSETTQAYWIGHKPIYFALNYLIMFPNLYYHTILQNDLTTHKCTYTQTHTNESQNNIHICIHT